jgi:hypothetical protein
MVDTMSLRIILLSCGRFLLMHDSRHRPSPAWAVGGCCARIGGTFPPGSPRKGARCGNPARYEDNVGIEGDNFVIGLCGTHGLAGRSFVGTNMYAVQPRTLDRDKDGSPARSDRRR